MKTREKKIIDAVIEEYVRTARPVSSKEISDNYDFGLSSATIRLEMAHLTRKGYLCQPHTSAGRIPTDKAYRFFVNNLPVKKLSEREEKNLRAELLKTRVEYNRLARASARLLAHLSHALAMNVIGKEESFFEAGTRDILKNPEFKEIENMAELMETMDVLLEKLCKLPEDNLPRSRVLIGREDPLRSKGLALISRCYRLPSGKKGVIALLGPKRMRYEKNISLVDYIAKILSNDSK